MCCCPTQVCTCCICLICVVLIVGGLFGFGVFSDAFHSIKHTVHAECDRNLQGFASMEGKLLSPHVIIFPLPVQGHLNSMLKLAELLSLAGLNITFLNSDNNQKRLLRYTDIHARFANYSGFQFKTFSDGLPEEHPRTVDQAREILEATNLSGKPFLKDLLTDIRPPVSCIIGDGILGFVSDVATELKIPLIHFRTASACSFWTYFCIPQLIQVGELPLKGKEGMDRLLTTVPGMEEFLRGRDLPSFCRVNDINDGFLQSVVNETVKSSEVDGLLLNTFEDLEGPVLSHIRTKCPKIYTIGPLHLHLQARLAAANDMKPSQLSSNSLWEVDKSCMSWLDKQPSQSVIYVSFGSLAVFTREQLMEFWYGLVNSEHRFLWVIRPGSVGGDDDSAMELVEGTKERGYMVGWAPQEEVLAHKAIGGFLTHSGWNSTLESIVAGVPMICWPCFGDQQVNSRYVSEVWKIGVDMKDVCDRKIVEKMVNDLMVDRREGFLKSADKFATLARKSISEGGSSCCNLDRLINDIMDMSSQAHSI